MQVTLAEQLAVFAVTELVALAFLSGFMAGTVAFVYRWYARAKVQTGLGVLVGLSGVALYRGTTTALSQVINSGTSATDPLSAEVALFNVTAFVVAGLVAVAAVNAGDRLGTTVFAATGGRDLEGEVSRVVEAVGRVVSVALPEDIEDTVGYDPVPEETKEKLAGRTFLFPKRLTVAELEERLTARLKADYGVGHVDVDLATDGSVEFLAVGSRAAGLGPTLPPATAAVAIQADPAFAASAGDVVQVWDPESAERITTAELRGVTDDVVTLAVDAADVEQLDDDTTYRLVTLPVDARPDREFASLLRAADETMTTARIQETSPLVDQPISALDASIVAVRTGDGVEAIPSRDRTLAAGDAVYAVAKPEALRKLEAAASADAPADGDSPPAADD